MTKMWGRIMNRHKKHSGFTLVELAIDLTIIGLLIGGILKGQQLMTNSRVTATISQVQAIDAATTTFRDTYAAMPGDLNAANARIVGYANRATTTNIPTLNDGIVGLNNWDLSAAQARIAVANPGRRTENETLFFWAQLSKAGLLSGIVYDGNTLAANSAEIGSETPTARIAGTFIVGYADGNTAQRLSLAVAPGPSRVYPAGTFLALTLNPITALPITNAANVLAPSIAAQMDRKMDDGAALTGGVQAYGRDATATSGCLDGRAAPYPYNENTSQKNCGMLFRIQG